MVRVFTSITLTTEITNINLVYPFSSIAGPARMIPDAVCVTFGALGRPSHFAANDLLDFFNGLELSAAVLYLFRFISDFFSRFVVNPANISALLLVSQSTRHC